MHDVTAASAAAADESPERNGVISHLYWLWYLADFRRWKLMVCQPPGNGNFLYNVTPIVHSARYTHDSRFHGQVKQRILPKPELDAHPPRPTRQSHMP